MIDTQSIKTIVEESKDYFDSQLELTKLKTAEQASKGISIMMTALIIGAFVLLTLICIGLYLGFYLAEYYDSYSTGFGLVSAGYILISILLFLFKSKIFIKPIQNKVIQEIFKDDE